MRMRWAALLLVLVCAAVTPAGLDAARGRWPAGALTLNEPVVGMAATPTGYRLVARDGGLFTFGDASFDGSLGNTRLNQPIVGMGSTPTGDGYWMVAGDGGIFTFGGAGFFGSMGHLRLNEPVVGMAPTPSGAGYWLVARDGGIFSFGDARFFGSTGDLRLNSPVVGMAASPSGGGYWLVAGDGGVFAFGDAGFVGSTGGIRLNSPVAGIASSASDAGYWLVANDGGVFSFGDAPFLGSAGNVRLNEPMVGMAATKAADGYWLVAADGGIFTYGMAPFHGSPQALPGAPPAPATPNLSVETVLGGLDIPWDLGFTPDGAMLFTERAGRIKVRRPDGVVRLLDTVPDVYASGEGGLLGLAVSPDFASSRSFVACYGWAGGGSRDVRLARWTVDQGYTAAVRGPVLVSGMPNQTGRHTGCRPRFGPDGKLWIGTGDAVVGSVPQDLGSLGGKVLRVEPATGEPAQGNPFGTRVYSYGHRNVQGLAFRPGSGQLFAAEHGTNLDDEVNIIRPGANYGYDPRTATGGYNERAPMTNTTKFPDAVPAIWGSGTSTVAPSGAAFLSGEAWGSWNGALVLAALRGQQLRILFLGTSGGVAGQTTAITTQGRLRAAVQGPDGSLYVTTSNGGGLDKILRITPA